MWLKAVLLIIVALTVVISGSIAFGSYRWKTGTNDLRAKLEGASIPIVPTTYCARETENLPPPVRRYFRVVLIDTHSIVSAVRLSHEGQFNMGETEAKWTRFKSSQLAIMQRPGLVWDGRISLATGINVFAHDAYVAGEGILHVALLGLVTLADIRGTPEAAQGELMRFLAEAAWYPTALLPSQGVRWEAIDDMSARATLTDGSTSVSLDFQFDAEGLISGVRAAARYRMVNGILIATPWQGRFWNYEVRDGMRIPLEGEVSWELPNGLWPYWRGYATDVAYEFAR
ncbi:DUF6920 family protein [Thermodesulfobacteriota bacterium]